jgi:putative FmdB family regulatory protein
VPTYQYTCTDCGQPLEAVQRFTDPALTECPTCGGALRKVFSSVGVVFKGSGFYRTDSRAGAKGGSNGDGSGSKDGAKTGDTAPAGAKGSDASANGSGSGSSNGSGSAGSAGSSSKPASSAA